jgi:hypothetical protein
MSCKELELEKKACLELLHTMEQEDIKEELKKALLGEDVRDTIRKYNKDCFMDPTIQRILSHLIHMDLCT